MQLFPKAIILFISVIFIAGCGKAIHPVFSEDLPPENVSEKNYKIGTEQEVHVGESIIRVKEYVQRNIATSSVTPTENFSIGDPSDPVMKGIVGEPINIAGIVEEKEQRYRLLPTFHHQFLFPINESGQYLGGVAVRIIGGFYSGNEVSFRSTGSIGIHPNSVRFEPVTKRVVDKTKGYVNYEIIYTGIDSNSINLLYREYTVEDIARVAFYQNLTYPLGTKAIRFKNTKIQITKTDEEGIVYTVVED